MTKDEIAVRYKSLKHPPATANKQWFQDRGRSLEVILKELLESEGLKPRTRFRPEGEEIDGSFVLASRVLLLEAKWHANPIPASSLYSFKSKVDGKLVGTLGVFVSMSGYSTDAVDALVKGKELNLILFDLEDIEFALAISGSFTVVLETKLRAASEEGVVYFRVPANEVMVHQTRHGVQREIEVVAVDKPSTPQTLSLVCEGVVDQVILTELLARLMSELFIQSKVRILVAGGKQNLPRVANMLSSQTNQQTIVVVDADSNKVETIDVISKTLNNPLSIIIAPDPTLEEAWLGLRRETIPFSATSSEFQHVVNAKVSELEFERLLATDDAFRSFWEILSKLQRGQTGNPNVA